MLILEIAAGIVLGFFALATIELWLPLVGWLIVIVIVLLVLAAATFLAYMGIESFNGAVGRETANKIFGGAFIGWLLFSSARKLLEQPDLLSSAFRNALYGAITLAGIAGTVLVPAAVVKAFFSLSPRLMNDSTAKVVAYVVLGGAIIAFFGQLYLLNKNLWRLRKLAGLEPETREEASSLEPRQPDGNGLEQARRAADARAKAAWAEFDRLCAERAKAREPLSDEEMADRLLGSDEE